MPESKSIENISNNSVQFTCKCGKYESWISEGKQTEPCPECGREYFGIYSKENLAIKAVELKPRLNRIDKHPISKMLWRFIHG